MYMFCFSYLAAPVSQGGPGEDTGGGDMSLPVYGLVWAPLHGGKHISYGNKWKQMKSSFVILVFTWTLK